MYLGEPKHPLNPRHPLWSKETCTQELLESSSTITDICKRYAPSANKWKALYFDIRRWKLEDPEFARIADEHARKTDSKKRKKIVGGRPRKDEDPKHHDWKLRYCEELLETKSRNKAALVTPYSTDEIYMMLHEKYSTYDEKFAELVHLTEMRLVAWAEEEIWNSLGEATNPKDRAWIAKEILKVRDRQKWGDKLDMTVTGSIAHHLLPERRQKLLEDLSIDHARFSKESEKPLLPAELTQSVPIDWGYSKNREVVDVEVVEDNDQPADSQDSA